MERDKVLNILKINYQIIEDCLGTKVDLVTHNMLKSPIRQTVEQEAIYVS